MPVPTDISQLSQTAASNSPAGSESPTTADDYLRTYASYIAQLRDGEGFTQEATVASAATADIGAANSLYVQITGTTTITSFGTNYVGPRFVRFAAALTLTHNATTLILPGGANITTAAGDTCVVVPTGNVASGWRVVSYQVGGVVPGTPADGSVTAAKIASGAVTPAKFSTDAAYSLQGFRNRLINGDMRIDQRNAGALVNPAANGIYYLDRWRAISAAAGKFSIGQNAGSVTPPAGFVNYLGITSLSAYAAGTSEAFAIRQSIEGVNTADLSWGTSGASAATLSFWVRSSLTGTFGGTVRNSAQDRTYPFTYSIGAANTWEFKTVTIAGDTSGTWLTTTGAGVELQFNLGAGATVSGGTVGAWNAGNFQAPASTVSVVGTNGATFYITGVQLEAGSTATPFERRSYGQELALCQRYYVNSPLTAIIPGYGTSPTANAGASFTFPVTMRSSPTVVLGTGANGTSFAASAISTYGFVGTCSPSGAAAPQFPGYTAAAEL